MKKYIPLMAVSLLLSLVIYVFYRTEKTLINQLFISLFDKETYVFLKERVTALLPLPDCVIYSLPEGLWVFCITLTSGSFYLEIYKRKYNLLFVPILLALLMEIFQMLRFTNGRFDFIDIVFATAFWLLALFYTRTNLSRQPLFQPVSSTTIFCISSYLIVYLAHVNY